LTPAIDTRRVAGPQRCHPDDGQQRQRGQAAGHGLAGASAQQRSLGFELGSDPCQH